MNKPDPGGVHGLTKENLLGAFPLALDQDSMVQAQAEITANELVNRKEEIDLVRLYAAIDRMPEELLDILARDFKVDWWDPEYSLTEKRRTLKDSWYVHKHLGTKAAVETALRVIYPKAEVQEWFEYGGEPYYFKLNIDLTGEISDAARPWRVIERVNFYKSLRSHMEKIVFTTILPPASLHVGGGVGVQAEIGVPLEPDVYDFQGSFHLGGTVEAQPVMGLPLGEDACNFQGALRAGGRFSASATVPVREDMTQPSATTILRSGGECWRIGS